MVGERMNEEEDNCNFWLGDEPEFAVNEAAIYFEDDKLIVSFGDGKVASIEIERDEERDVVKRVLSDANTWAAFLGSLSAALKEHM